MNGNRFTINDLLPQLQELGYQVYDNRPKGDYPRANWTDKTIGTHNSMNNPMNAAPSNPALLAYHGVFGLDKGKPYFMANRHFDQRSGAVGPANRNGAGYQLALANRVGDPIHPKLQPGVNKFMGHIRSGLGGPLPQDLQFKGHGDLGPGYTIGGRQSAEGRNLVEAYKNWQDATTVNPQVDMPNQYARSPAPPLASRGIGQMRRAAMPQQFQGQLPERNPGYGYDMPLPERNPGVGYDMVPPEQYSPELQGAPQMVRDRNPSVPPLPEQNMDPRYLASTDMQPPQRGVFDPVQPPPGMGVYPESGGPVVDPGPGVQQMPEYALAGQDMGWGAPPGMGDAGVTQDPGSMNGGMGMAPTPTHQGPWQNPAMQSNNGRMPGFDSPPPNNAMPPPVNAAAVPLPARKDNALAQGANAMAKPDTSWISEAFGGEEIADPEMMADGFSASFGNDLFDGWF